jgi:galactokinase
VIVAGARNSQSSKLHLVNVNAKYEEKQIAVSSEPVVIDRSHHNWTNYFLCGYKGMIETIKPESPIGLDLCVSGTVPAGAGMSSSSALVCAAALATATAYRKQMENSDIADLAQRSERFVGTESGGMDQGM